ncbi:MAG TPA: hypothetical protein VFY13_09090, partial [Luteolibacter sp.]|nr:hypothetical protein [Luteolibacter sp.]
HKRMRERSLGWVNSARPAPGFTDMAGFAQFNRQPAENNAYLVVSLPANDKLSPLHGGLLSASIAWLVLCMAGGMWLLRRELLWPLGRIWKLLDSMATLARLRNHFPDDRERLREQQRQVEGQLHDIQQLRTGDRLESMARETSTLVSRVLRYQHDLEKEEDQP